MSHESNFEAWFIDGEATGSGPTHIHDQQQQPLLQQQQQQQQRQVAQRLGLRELGDVEEAILRERDEEIERVAQQLNAVTDVERTLVTTLQEQAEQLQPVEESLTTSLTVTEETILELVNASRLQASLHPKRGLLFGAATGAVVGTAVGTAAGLAAFGVGSVPGGIGGAAVGAVVGTVVAGTVGVTSGRVIQYKLNRQLDQEVLTQVYGKEWVPDSGTVCCMRCGAKFTKTRRRHHCRRCGQVLCKKCCHRKEELFARGMERPIKQRVCVDCETRT